MSPLSRHLRCFLVTIAYAALCILTSSSAAIAPPTPPPIPPSPPADRAAALVANMTTEERLSLLAGTGWALVLQKSGYYVGNSVPIARLGIPALKMQDAAQGFRTTDKRMIGQVTSWPCSLAVAATWDLNLTRAWGRALGEEHRAKGANVILGPSINVHRVARGGRNAEYLSGESPALGGKYAWDKMVMENWGGGLQCGILYGIWSLPTPRALSCIYSKCLVLYLLLATLLSLSALSLPSLCSFLLYTCTHTHALTHSLTVLNRFGLPF